MKTKDQIIKDQESIGNIQITEEEYSTLKNVGELVVCYEDDYYLYFKPKPEDKRVFENGDILIKLDNSGMLLDDTQHCSMLYLNKKDVELILEAIKEAERQGLWK